MGDTKTRKERERSRIKEEKDIRERILNSTGDLINILRINNIVKRIKRVRRVVVAVISLIILLPCTAYGVIKYELAHIDRGYSFVQDVRLLEGDLRGIVEREHEEVETIVIIDEAGDMNELDKAEIADEETNNNIVNILLCGNENMSGGRGRTDCIILATINNDTKSLKMTSIMRDTYVKIPGYRDNKINAAYAFGGIKLLWETIEDNFGVKLDGYVLVDFDGFERVIDLLGGVDITLTEREARYLNSTNYISNKENRNVIVGKQTLNGNQALGYSRVRYVPTANGLANDYARNYRQRTVLNEIFDKYKSKSIDVIVGLLPKILKNVSTDLSDEEIIKYATNVLSLGVEELETYKVPIDGMYKGTKIRGMAVLNITNWIGTREKLKEYIEE